MIHSLGLWPFGTLLHPLLHLLLRGRGAAATCVAETPVKNSLLLTNEETGKSPNTLVLQRSSCGSLVLVSCLSPLSPGAQEKEIAQDGFMALLSCVNPVPAIYPAGAHGSSFLSETSMGIWWTGMWLRVGEIPFTTWNPQQSQQGCEEEGRGEKGKVTISSLFSWSVVSNSLWPQGLQHARLPCPSPFPGICSNSCPLSQRCHPTILSLSPTYPLAFNLSQNQMARVLELQHQSFQWILRVDFL